MKLDELIDQLQKLKIADGIDEDTLVKLFDDYAECVDVVGAQSIELREKLFVDICYRIG